MIAKLYSFKFQIYSLHLYIINIKKIKKSLKATYKTFICKKLLQIFKQYSYNIAWTSVHRFYQNFKDFVQTSLALIGGNQIQLSLVTVRISNIFPKTIVGYIQHNNHFCSQDKCSLFNKYFRDLLNLVQGVRVLFIIASNSRSPICCKGF